MQMQQFNSEIESDMDLLSFQRNFSLDGRSLTSFNDLPDCLAIDILSRLPVKACVLSTSVSKKWYSIIKCPSFISVHLSRSISDPSRFYIFLVRRDSPLVSVVSDYNHVLTRHPNFNIPFETLSGTYKAIGTCNGLVCLTDHYPEYHGRDIYLINPFIHKYKKIGAESSCYSDLIDEIDGFDSGIIRVSFWYCEVENDYKIFRILFRYGYARAIVLTRFEIYSLNSGKWKVMEGMDALDNCDSAPIFVNGCLYWPPCPELGYLQCFDLKAQVFYNINLPSSFQSLNYILDGGVFAKNGSVAILAIESEIMAIGTIYMSFLEKRNGGHFLWKELRSYDIAPKLYHKCIGFSPTGRFIFADLCYNYRWNIVALDLDKPLYCAFEKFALDNFDRLVLTAAINVLESLALFSG